MRKPTDTHGIATLARAAVRTELLRRGAAAVAERRIGNRTFLDIGTASGEVMTVIVKSKTKGTWQVAASDGDPEKAQPNAVWIFVDLADRNAPVFFIAPDTWVRMDIAEHHASYLKRHGGKRKVTQDSNHHAIQSSRVDAWKNRWELLGLR